MQKNDVGADGRSATPGSSGRRPHGRGWRSVALGVLLVLLLAGAGTAAGLWYADQRGAEVHTARATVLLRPLEGNAFNPSSTGGTDLVNMETEAQLVGSSVVAGLAAERLGVPGAADELRGGLDSSVPPNTQLVEIVAEGADDQEAVDRAQTVATTFLAFRADRAESDLFDRGAGLREQIRARDQQRRRLVTRLGKVDPNSPQAVIRRQRIGELTTQLAELRVQLAEIEAASSDPGQVVTEASAEPPGPLGRPWVLVALGGAVGLVLGLLLVLGGRRRRGTRVHGPDDLARTGVPVFGRLPRAAEQRPHAVGGVRAALLATQPSRPLVVGVAASADPDGDEVLAATADLAGELGLSLRRAGLAVAVLDLGPRPGGRARTTPGDEDAPSHDGPLLSLAALLDAGHALPEVLARRRASGLPLAIVNDLGEDGLADRASSPEMTDLLQALRHVADVVVVDLGSLAETSAQSLLGSVDTVVLAVREGRSTFTDLEASVDRLPTWGGRLAGLVCLAARSRGDQAPTSAAAAMRSRTVPENAAPDSMLVAEEPG